MRKKSKVFTDEAVWAFHLTPIAIECLYYHSHTDSVIWKRIETLYSKNFTET